jgi:hypothetical protein
MKTLQVAGVVLTLFFSGCSSSSNEESSSAAIDTCQAADEEDLKLVNQGMIDSRYRIESGFTAMFPPREDEPRYIVAPPYDYVLAATIRGIDGDSVIGLWGIWKYRHFGEARIFALNKQAHEYSIDLAYWDGSGRGEEFTATAEDKARILQLSVDANLIACLQK